MSLFAHDIIVYIEIPKGSTKKTPRQLTNEFGQVSTRKSIIFVRTNDKCENRNCILNTIYDCSKENEILRYRSNSMERIRRPIITRFPRTKPRKTFFHGMKSQTVTVGQRAQCRKGTNSLQIDLYI